MDSTQLRELCLKKFPFPTPNPGQIEAIQEAVEQLLAGTTYVILQAPTGSGKSVIATTVHRVMKEIKGKWRTGIITGTKGLQNQYINDDPEIYDLKGRTNYECPKGAKYYNHLECRKMVGSGRCNKHAVCPYIQRREKWCKDEALRLTNFSFMIEAPYSLVADNGAETNLMIVDECHELPEKLIDHNKAKFNTKDFFYVESAIGPNILGIIADFINTFMDMKIGTAFIPNDTQKEDLKFLEDRILEFVSNIKDDLGNNDISAGRRDTLLGAEEELNGVLEKIRLVAYTEGEWILTDYNPSELLELTPVYASQVSYPGLLCKAPQFIMMSATICGFDEYRKDLGIKDSYHYIDVESPLPVKNRPVVVIPRVGVSGKGFDEDKWMSLIDSIIEKNGMKNGVIHTVSFALAEKIKTSSKFKKRMVVSNKRDEILSLLNKSNTGKIILSPSITTGYDFKGDLARWQIIAKCPFGFLGDPRIKLNTSRNPRWYSRETVLKIVQASGRVCRGVDDYGITFVVDSNIIRLLKQNSDLFPDWWLESVVIKN